MNRRYSFSRPVDISTVATHLDESAKRVLRNTWMLLSLCLGFSAIVAGLSMTFQLPYPGMLITMIGYFGLLWLVMRNRNKAIGIVMVFALTGFMGYTLGPILNLYLKMPNGTQTVMTALGGTAIIFVCMSAWALVSKRDLSFMGGMLGTGILVAFLAGLAAIFLNMPILSLAVSAVFVILMSGMILFQTNQIVRGGETNYIVATVQLFVSIFNLFLSLLQLIGFVNSSD